jgi:UbiA prenyltransferase family
MLSGLMNRLGKWAALFATARVANVPSVICNVWLGVAVGGWGSLAIPWTHAVFLAAAGVMLYVGGNFLNDWMDRDWDARQRPERALPRGVFSAGGYLAAAVCLLAAGVGTAWVAQPRSGWVAVGIVGWILIYTVWHKRSAWAVVAMGLCRALLPVMGFLALQPYVDMIWPVATALFCYIMGLSLSARYESLSEPPPWVRVTARGLLLLAAVLVAWGNKALILDRLPSVCGALPYLAWTSFCLKFRRRPLSRLVSGLLAGIPLVDAMLLLPLGVTCMNASSNGALAPVIACFLMPTLAFISALWLQRLAPAT